jgi:hypothetical protein
MANYGPPTRKAGYSAHQDLNNAGMAEPVVSTLDRASLALGCDPAQLAQAVQAAGLPVWARHADGSDCFRWPELVEAARDHLGIRVPVTRPTLAAWQVKRQAKRERQRASNGKSA